MRETGYYWCLYEGQWTTCYYSLNLLYWVICGSTSPYYDDEFQEIDEKRIKRE